MNRFAKLIILVSTLFTAPAVLAQQTGNDVFAPISKYLTQGDVESLSAWFADNLEVSIFANGTISSRNQARQILNRFFDSYTPRSFKIDHCASRTNIKTILGTLTAGGENFLVTILVSRADEDVYLIRQIKVDRRL